MVLDNLMRIRFQANKPIITRSLNARRRMALFLAHSSVLVTLSTLMGCATDTMIYVESTNQNSLSDSEKFSDVA